MVVLFGCAIIRMYIGLNGDAAVKRNQLVEFVIMIPWSGSRVCRIAFAKHHALVECAINTLARIFVHSENQGIVHRFGTIGQPKVSISGNNRSGDWRRRAIAEWTSSLHQPHGRIHAMGHQVVAVIIKQTADNGIIDALQLGWTIIGSTQNSDADTEHNGSVAILYVKAGRTNNRHVRGIVALDRIGSEDGGIVAITINEIALNDRIVACSGCRFT